MGIEIIAGAILLYTATKIIYNVYFHPLARYNGPFLWCAFQFPSLVVMLGGRLPYRIKQLHDQYGPIVRIGPNELSLTDEHAWKDIFLRRDFLRPPQWGARPPGVDAHNLISAPADVHARFRKAFAPAFSEKALSGYEPLIREYFDKLLARLESKSSTAVDMMEWFNFTTFDIIGELCWGRSFGCLESGKGHAFIDILLHFKAALIGTVIKHYPAIDAFMPYITPKSALNMLHNVFQTGHQRIQERISSEDESRTPDILSHVLHYNSSNPAASNLSQAEVEFNALTMIIAGSETLTTALSGALHQLLSHPNAFESLTSELRTTFKTDDEITASTVTTLPYLNAVLNETLRMCPPLPDNLRRTVPKGGATVVGHNFSEGTVLGVSCWSMFQSEEHFSSPTEFTPERWLSTSDRMPNHNLKAFYPFSLGPHGCIGQSLAWLQLRLLLALLLFRFDLEVFDVKGETQAQKPWNWNEQKIYWTWEKKSLMVQIKPRM
jgi:cytochrome P450